MCVQAASPFGGQIGDRVKIKLFPWNKQTENCANIVVVVICLIEIIDCFYFFVLISCTKNHQHQGSFYSVDFQMFNTPTQIFSFFQIGKK